MAKLMTLLVILAGLYIILGIGYYKTISRNEALKDHLSPIVRGLILALTVIWPIMIAYTLLVEAVKSETSSV